MRMGRSRDTQPESVDLPPPLTPEKVQRALDWIATIQERIRRRGVDVARLPDPVEELRKVRDAGAWE
jgi:hypothetical protein